MARVKKKQQIEQMNWKPLPEDKRLMAEIRAVLGVNNNSDILRMAIRALAEQKGIPLTR